VQVTTHRLTAPLFGLLCLAASGVAQEAGRQGVEAPDGARRDGTGRPGRHRLGPAWVTLRLQLRNAGMDTNVFQTFLDPVRDEVIVLALQGDGRVALGRRLRLSGSGFVARNSYVRQGEESSTEFDGDGRADLDLGRLRLAAGGGGGHFTQRLSIDVDERLPRAEKRGFARATLDLTRRLSATGRVTGEVVTFSPGTFRLGGDVKEAMDRNTVTATGELRQALTPRTGLVASANVIEDRFISQPASLPRVRRSYRYLAGLEFSERAIVSGKLLVGLRRFPGTLAQGSPPYEGPIAVADLTLPVGRVAHLRFQGLRDVLYASSLVQVGDLRYRNAFVYQRYAGEAFLPLAPTGLATVLSAGFEQSRYLLPYPYLDPFRLADRVDHRWSAGAGLVQRIGRSVRIEGRISWARRVSSLPFFSYEDLQYGVSAEVVP
jgi:hypothetical protein